MRKIYLYLAILILFSCNREDIKSEDLKDENFISLKESKSIADSLQRFILHSKTKANTGVNKSRNTVLEKEITGSDGTVVMRIFNYTDGGFIILAADRRANPVLAYSDETNFSSGIVAIAADTWLNDTKLEIEGIKAKGSKGTNIADKLLKKAKYTELLSGNTVSTIKTKAVGGNVAKPPPPVCEDIDFMIGPLLTTSWSQEGGYNNYMPAKSCTPYYCNGKAFTGCVATAMAQVMRYHQYPSTFNYSIMPSAVSGYTDVSAGANEISKLMWHAADNVGSNYTCTSTGAAANTNAISSTIQTFGYSPTATAASFNYLTVESEIKANRPVILTGYSTTSGHCWVADGLHKVITCPETLPNGSTIGGGGYLWFHMNWGWGGQNNGWFGYASADSGNGNYSTNRDMVYSIHK
ncbi:C10 family peptidase [Sphingobacterium sp.]|uniref:C10 family peptidase n=1 Tax=Sphingobacterium sp. TaxID=341027 RepID=UPI0028A7748A|nr:C10 family peptidase [Sphingobacterium sp.]